MAVRREEQLWQLKGEGLRPILSRRLEEEIGEYDVIFNTAPELLLTEPVLRALRPGARVVDLASRPGGVDWEWARALEIKAVQALALPGVLTPVSGALAIRKEIEGIAADVAGRGYKNICYLGIGGTYASALQTQNHVQEYSGMEIIAQNAALYNTTGNRRIGKDTVIVLSSVTGTTQEVVAAVEKAKAQGAVVIGFVDTADTPLEKLSDYAIRYPQNEQLKFFMLADRLMQLAGDFPQYEQQYAEYDRYLPQALVETEKAADDFGRTFAERHCNDAMHYFVGAGNQYGSTYSYAMCYWEEQHWLRSKSIHAAEFFHGTLEIVDKDTPVTLFMGEDAQRPLSERVKNFLPRVCGNYTIIDAADYPLTGISPAFRGDISHLVTHAVTQRIDAHMEQINRHPMEIRRYYRQFPY